MNYEGSMSTTAASLETHFLARSMEPADGSYVLRPIKKREMAVQERHDTKGYNTTQAVSSGVERISSFPRKVELAGQPS